MGGEGLLSTPPRLCLFSAHSFPNNTAPSLHAPRAAPGPRTCGSHSPEVVCPAQHHAGPVAGALNQGPGQGGEQEDHGQVQHCHEEWEVEALGAQSTDSAAWFTAPLPTWPGQQQWRWPRGLPGLYSGQGAPPSPDQQSLGMRDS